MIWKGLMGSYRTLVVLSCVVYKNDDHMKYIKEYKRWDKKKVPYITLSWDVKLCYKQKNTVWAFCSFNSSYTYMRAFKAVSKT